MRKRAPEVERAEKVRHEQFAAADEVLQEVRKIRRAASAIEDYAAAEQDRLHRRRAE